MSKTATWRRNPDTGEWCAYISVKTQLPPGTHITLTRADGSSTAAIIVAAEKTISRGILYSFRPAAKAAPPPPPREQATIAPARSPACLPVSAEEQSMQELYAALGLDPADYEHTAPTDDYGVSLDALDACLGLETA